MVDVEKKTSWRLVKTDEEEFVIPWNKDAKVKYYLDEAKRAEEREDIFGCKSWLLTGVSIVPDSFDLQVWTGFCQSM
ncbi:unnamed protein product [Allacma fusca]|uniref:Uncharacterized protein n=1 Tax=Allacma fusca TaxID=39272 RepID=A0A8J2KZU3_9HEXA|nr:unnamed protein product [Allacma fusca]